MPNIRFRNPNGDELDFVDVDENDFIGAEAWRVRGWVEEPRDEPPAEQLQAVREQAEIQARQVWNELVQRAELAPPPVNEPIEVRQWEPQVRNAFRGAELRFFGAGAGVGRSTVAVGKKGEELFRLILSGIKEIYGVDAVVAGGAVRDLVVGDVEGTKDVDVFIPLKWEDFDKSSDELGWQGKPGLLRNKPYKTTVAKTSSARASAVVQGMPVDLVFIDGGLTPEGVDGFPVNAQKCVWNLSEGLVVSPDAKKDIDGKKFTISPKLTDKDLIKTIRDKVAGWLKRPCYKGWKVIEPEIKEWWQKQNDPHTVERAKKKKKVTFDDKLQMLDARLQGWWGD